MPVEEHDSRRKQQYKNVAKHEDMRRRRNEGSMELRKQKKDDQLMKRRNVGGGQEDSDLSDIDVSSTVSSQPTANSFPRLTAAEAVAILSNSPSLEQMSYTFEAIRRMLSRTREPPVQEIIDAGLLNALVQGLSVPDNKVQFEAAWALTNVVSGTAEQTLKAVEAGVIPALVKLCCSPFLPVAEQATWAMANIAGDCGQMRDRVIDAGGANALLHLTAKIGDLGVEFVRTLAWAYSNLCRHKNPQTSIEVLRQLTPGIAILMAASDKVVVQDSCWALSYMTDGPDEQIELALKAGVLSRVVKLLDSDESSMLAPALRVLGNFVTGNDALTQVVVDSGVLQTTIGRLMETKSSAIVKECCWFISNVIAGTQSQIQAVVDAGLLQRLIQVLEKGEFKCQYEAGWALANLAQGGNADQVFNLYRLGAIPPMCRALLAKSSEFVINILETLFIILRTSENHFPVELDNIRCAIEEAEGLDFMERLQQHDNTKVYETAYKIIDNFFNDEEEENKENMQLETMESVTAPSQGFKF